MTAKQIAHDVIDSLSDETSIDEIIHALYINTKFKNGEQEIEEGRGIPHNDALEQLKKWQT